mmetsp:Transcript_15372/g.31183  ORF Transcript_15372/g.31183 Transcript_15372/m.31183 type:complete len:115 (-) Transcript_15372:1562-1906(-)
MQRALKPVPQVEESTCMRRRALLAEDLTKEYGIWNNSSASASCWCWLAQVVGNFLTVAHIAIIAIIAEQQRATSPFSVKCVHPTHHTHPLWLLLRIPSQHFLSQFFIWITEFAA